MIGGLDTTGQRHYDPFAMTRNLPPRTLSRCDWVRRCAAKIRDLDDVVTLIDAADLANTLRDLPCCQDLEPEAAAARLFQDNLTATQWGDLSTLCDRAPPGRPVLESPGPTTGDPHGPLPAR